MIVVKAAKKQNNVKKPLYILNKQIEMKRTYTDRQTHALS